MLPTQKHVFRNQRPQITQKTPKNQKESKKCVFSLFGLFDPKNPKFNASQHPHSCLENSNSSCLINNSSSSFIFTLGIYFRSYRDRDASVADKQTNRHRKIIIYDEPASRLERGLFVWSLGLAPRGFELR